MGCPNFALDVDHRILYLWCSKLISKFQAEGYENLIRCEMHRQHTVGARGQAPSFGNTQN